MCRLFGWSSVGETTLESALGADLNLLTDLSSLHRDGWGGAVTSGGTLTIVKDVEPANSSSEFKEFAHDIETHSGIVHLRWATSNYSVCIENTHPFVGNNIAFIHNGGFENAESLIELIDEDLLAQRVGSVDSELYFLYLQTLLRTNTIADAYRHLISLMKLRTPFSSLNAMILTPTHLYVVSAYDDERRPQDVEADYYHLSYSNSADLFSAWSSGVRSGAGTSLPNEHLLTFDFSTRSLSSESLA